MKVTSYWTRSCLALTVIVILFATVVRGQGERSSPSRQQRLNFVFIITDDQRWDALGVVQREMGDRVRFRNAFVTTSLCLPSRAAFLTGSELRHPQFEDPPLSNADWREVIAAYYACISFVDAQVGVLLDQMDKLELWEESIRAPLIVAAPGKRAGAKSPRVVEFLDIYPTLVQLCGLPDPGGLQGASFAPLLSEPDAPWERAAFTVLADNEGKAIRARSVRTERWHYVEYGQAGKEGAMRSTTTPARPARVPQSGLGRQVRRGGCPDEAAARKRINA